MKPTERIASTIQTLISNRKMFDWQTLVEVIKTENIPVSDWRMVRNVLQGFIHRGKVTRVPSVFVEEYEVIGN